MPPRLDSKSETERIAINAPQSLLKRIDEWRRKQPELPNRAVAVRQLIEAGIRQTAAK